MLSSSWRYSKCRFCLRSPAASSASDPSAAQGATDLDLALSDCFPSGFMTPRFGEIRGGFRIVQRSLADPPADLCGSQGDPKFCCASAFGLELFLVDRRTAGQDVADDFSAQCARLLFEVSAGQADPFALDERNALNLRPAFADRGWNVTDSLVQRVDEYWHRLAMIEPPLDFPVNPVLRAILDLGAGSAHDDERSRSLEVGLVNLPANRLPPASSGRGRHRTGSSGLWHHAPCACACRATRTAAAPQASRRPADNR